MRVCLHLGNGWPKRARKFRQDEQLNVAKKEPRIGLTSDDVISRDHCPVCGGGDLLQYEKLYFQKIAIPYQRCQSCDLVFMNPVPNQAWYDRIYGHAFRETKLPEAAGRWLVLNGVVLMETPNSTVQNSTHIYHPYCFSRASLQRLYRGHGYEILSIRPTGRPSPVLIPRYLTLTARRNTEIAAPGTRTYESGGRRLGHCWRRTIRGMPLKNVDSMLTGLLYAPSDAVKRRAAESATAYDAAGEMTQR